MFNKRSQNCQNCPKTEETSELYIAKEEDKEEEKRTGYAALALPAYFSISATSNVVQIHCSS